MENLIDCIKKIQKRCSNEIDYLNHGGCGYFAYYMYNELIELGYKPTIKILYGWEEEFNDSKVYLNNYFNNGNTDNLRNTSFSHCCLEIGGLLFDSELIGLEFIENWVKSRFKYIYGEYSIAELKIALKFGGWNTQYKKEKYDSVLKNIIKDGLAPLRVEVLSEY